jgi:hypothetical protein
MMDNTDDGIGIDDVALLSVRMPPPIKSADSQRAS